MMNVLIYTTTTCPYCKQLKDYLETNKIVFTEKLIDQDDKSREEMLKDSNGYLGVPFIVIIADDGTKETVVGFDKGKIHQILNLN